jgi:transposase-like protein
MTMYIDMVRMVRKQVYIRVDQESQLKRASKELGVTESELIRRGVDQATAGALKGPRDPEAWEEALAFMRKRAAMRVPQTGRTWTRDELYEDD